MKTNKTTTEIIDNLVGTGCQLIRLAGSNEAQANQFKKCYFND
jgi:hypothetical protein